MIGGGNGQVALGAMLAAQHISPLTTLGAKIQSAAKPAYIPVFQTG
ncbi:hypothetical protein SAMN05414139_06050 [Burkholderia sp. D7]|nr:hypothetical protein SAMN05414139_06050 [Burkholderia sp. D7]